MPISESQLQTWSNQGAVKASSNTYSSVKNAIDTYEFSRRLDYEIYLQGSYKNSTNIRGDSDVDIVLQLNSTFLYDLSILSESGRNNFHVKYPSDADYRFEDFRYEVFQALNNYYSNSLVESDNKSIKVYEDSGRLNADIIPCLIYKKYLNFDSPSEEGEYIEGIVFYEQSNNRKIVNFPKIHYDNGVNKNSLSRTNKNYKPTVRMFKNARSYLIDHSLILQNCAPSYFLECLLYNVPDRYFNIDYQNIFINIIQWIIDSIDNNDYQNFLCQNE